MSSIPSSTIDPGVVSMPSISVTDPSPETEPPKDLNDWYGGTNWWRRHRIVVKLEEMWIESCFKIESNLNFYQQDLKDLEDVVEHEAELLEVYYSVKCKKKVIATVRGQFSAAADLDGAHQQLIDDTVAEAFGEDQLPDEKPSYSGVIFQCRKGEEKKTVLYQWAVRLVFPARSLAVDICSGPGTIGIQALEEQMKRLPLGSSEPVLSEVDVANTTLNPATSSMIGSSYQSFQQYTTSAGISGETQEQASQQERMTDDGMRRNPLIANSIILSSLGGAQTESLNTPPLSVADLLESNNSTRKGRSASI
ncbi:hypothetical protein QFC19_004572 [Naganishia cerealis]|uniref:Uncharacterized protein n=1 Tax=Naganishia cerealis TaxID=610337 RepID=A0ACC2VUT4_9TREE|nr:hypothetical protein QFC19_004572 [Naganishia cerealis]